MDRCTIPAVLLSALISALLFAGCTASYDSSGKDDYEENDSFDQAYDLTQGSIATLLPLNFYDDAADYFILSFMSGDRIQFGTTIPANETTNTVLSLYDSERNLLATNDDCGWENYDSGFVHTFTSGGDYFIYVTTADRSFGDDHGYILTWMDDE